MKKVLAAASLLLVFAFLVAPFANRVSAQDADIVDTAASAGDFTTLVAAVEAAGLVETLKSEGPFTVFAPSDDAFAALPAGTIDALLADPTGDLADILLYHVVPGKVMAADLSDGQQVATANGASLTVSITDGGAMVNESNIIAVDIETSNGVIHVIDAVLIPPSDDMAAAGAEASEEATEESMEAEATAEPTEEAMEESMEAEATAEPTEEAMEEGAPEPTTLPVTGVSLPAMSVSVLAIVGVALFGAAFALRRREQ